MVHFVIEGLFVVRFLPCKYFPLRLDWNGKTQVEGRTWGVVLCFSDSPGDSGVCGGEEREPWIVLTLPAPRSSL